MQFRKQGNRVQVLAYRGYDKEKKRAAVKLLGSFGQSSFDMSDGLSDALTDVEMAELQSYISHVRQSNDVANRLSIANRMDSLIGSVADSLTDKTCANLVTAESASATYEAIDRLTKSLRKLGFKRLARGGPTVTEG